MRRNKEVSDVLGKTGEITIGHITLDAVVNCKVFEVSPDKFEVEVNIKDDIAYLDMGDKYHLVHCGNSSMFDRVRDQFFAIVKLRAIELAKDMN